MGQLKIGTAPIYLRLYLHRFRDLGSGRIGKDPSFASMNFVLEKELNYQD